MEFKDKLKKMRCEQNLSQQALADAIYVSRSAVAKWEAGLGLPCEESMQALENYFQVEKNHFLTERETLSTIPVEAISNETEVPPALKNGSGSPVVGITPITTAILRIA